MAISKALISLMVLSLLVLDLAQAVQTNQGTSSTLPSTTPVKPMDCGGACAGRCSLSSRPNLCKRACGTCCAKCQCVPPGTSGNLEACSCYATMTTRDKKRKCP
ncbi:snakin-2-like [Actinidia eriantha]|uniref:snakin-2-like n=1 Tax=Actinidia eriantha TaxID=165200 RepID=UPI002589AEA3|nr:snakin-2-like [Actinidia eriantha]